MMQYKWEYNHFAGSLSFVTSRDQTRFGSVAISSGFCLAGWVPCERGDGMINHFSLSGMLLLVGSCPNRAESFPWIEITCLAVSNSRSSRAFPIWNRATSLTDRLAGRAPNGRAGAARAQVMAWWRGGVVAWSRGRARRSRARCRELRGEAEHRGLPGRRCHSRQGCRFCI